MELLKKLLVRNTNEFPQDMNKTDIVSGGAVAVKLVFRTRHFHGS
jgi:hypothetical protein